MGTTYRVFCDCGFKTTINEGGTRDSFQTYSAFPFWCDRCGLIEVNTRRKIKCPYCKSEEITAYGDESITSEEHGASLADTKVIWSHDSLYEDFDGNSNDDGLEDIEYEIPESNKYSLCPRCRTFRLIFRGMINFD